MRIHRVLVAAVLLGSACAPPGGTIPSPSGGGVAVAAETALSFHRRVETFYRRLIKRRFNALETFEDPILRDYFRSPDRFFDYYADLAQALAGAHFEKSRPLAFEVQEFVFEDAERVQVQVSFAGKDGRPIRPGGVTLVRRDRWERAEGSWWIVPGKL